MANEYQVRCDCGSIEVTMIGLPKVHAFCHCEDCRALLDVPYHSVVAWEADKVSIVSGQEHAVEYKYPTLEMTRVFCKHCREIVYNTNAMGWRLVSQLLISKCNNGWCCARSFAVRDDHRFAPLHDSHAGVSGS